MIFYVRPRTILVLLVVFVLLVMQILFHHPAHADALPPENLRTVTFYANHRAFMHRMLTACRDDPGHGNTRPDCINARGGEMKEAEDDARRHIGLTLTSPATTTYWKLHATSLPSRLYFCEQASPEQQALMWCDAAKTASRQIDMAAR